MITNQKTAVAIIRRPVKHARLRVKEDATVELVAPLDFTDNQLEAILEKKSHWIERNRNFFLTRPRPVESRSVNDVSLFGEVFRFELTPRLRSRVVVQESLKVIRTGCNLNDQTVRDQWYRNYARQYLRERIEHLSKEHELPFGRLFVRFQRTRWGNCSVRKNISLNWQLVLAPRYVIDYVILHELLHTKIRNHTHSFWVYLKSLYPKSQKAREWLQDHVPL